MGDADNAMPPSKKRAAGKQLSRDDDPDAEEDVCGEETGTFQRASEEILASRRIVKIRRNTTSSSGAANPFASIRLVPPTAPSSMGVSAAKTSETSPSFGVDRQLPVAQEKGASKAKDKPSDGKNTSEAKEADSTLCEAKEICETKVAVATLNEAKEVCETKVAESVNDGDFKGKEEAPSETMEASKENGEGNKDNNRVSTENNIEQSTENKETAEVESVEEPHKKIASQQEPTVAVSSFQQLSSTQNAFAGISGTGFSSSSFTFGLLPKPGTSTVSFGSAFSSGSITGTGPLFGTKAPGSDGSAPSVSNGGASIRLFGAPASENATISGSSMLGLQEVPVETGEEKEKAVFTADSVLFEYTGKAWKERGKGELKVNLSTADTGKARLVMRSKGNYRLILNANLFPDMKLANMDKRGITFVCMNSAGEAKESLSTFALKFKDSSIVEHFRGVVEANKGNNNTLGDLKTPENSPKASEV